MAATKQIFNDLNLVIRLNQHIEDIASGSDEATAAALLTRQTSFQVLTELDAIQNPDAREDAQFDHQRADFHPEAAATDKGKDEPPSHLPFHLQGDQEFNKASAIAERRALQRSERIRTKVLFLWDVARGKKKAEVSRTASLDKLMDKAHTDKNASLNVIEERDYMDMMLLIFKVLRDDFVLDLAQLQVHCDWEVDSHHGNSLGFDQFFCAVFELVDLWTCDILEATYVRFLELLARRITLRVVIFLDDMKLKLALSDNFDEAVVVKAIPLSTIQKFASVAKVVERKGVRTVGDLANADPQMVERARREYVERNNFSKEKIGAKLQHLLDSFQMLSDQFDPGNSATYTLEDMKLVRRHHHAAGVDSSVSGGSGDPGKCGPASHQAVLSPGSNSSGQLFNGASPSSLSGSNPASTDPNAQSSSSGSLSRSNTRRLSIHDLSQAESGLINSLRSAFILEKRISINRKHDAQAVREELEKFGVDPKELSDPEVMEKYGGLYEMFVLRDGESIKTLAQTMLTQIKLELQAHGVVVDDEDAESAYDGFYGSVVASSGDAIVKDAQNWVDETVKTQGGAAPYIKADYHELKPLSQVTLIGSQPGDEEFVSLLSNDEEDSDEDDEQLPLEDSKPKNASPIQRKPSQMRIKQFAPPPIQTSPANSGSTDHTQEKPKAETPTPPPPSSSTVSPRRRSGPRVETKSHDPSKDDSNKRKKSKEDAHNKHQKHSTAGSDSQGRRKSRPEPAPADQSQPVENSGEGLNAPSDEPVVQHSADSDGLNNEANTPTPVVPVEVCPSEEDESVPRRRSSLSLKTMKSKSNLTVDTSPSDLKGSDTTNNEVDREAQGVEFGYDDEPPPVAEPEPVQQEIVVELVPKIPKIVIGTGADGANMPVAARYIQLLGLGTVLTAADEEGLYQLLESDEGKDVDLVCFDIGSQLDTAVEKLNRLQSQVGKRVIVLGGDVKDPTRTKCVADECLALGAIYFAVLPIDFPALRTEILTYFEKSTQPYIMRQRKTAASSSGAAAAAFKMASRSIGAASLFGMHDMSRKLSTPPSYANIAKSPKRKPTNPGGGSLLLPTAPMSPSASGSPRGAHGHLPSLVKEVTSLIHLKALDDIRASETTPMLIPTSPRSLNSYKKSSPRLSVALKKMMR